MFAVPKLNYPMLNYTLQKSAPRASTPDERHVPSRPFITTQATLLDKFLDYRQTILCSCGRPVRILKSVCFIGLVQYEYS